MAVVLGVVVVAVFVVVVAVAADTPERRTLYHSCLSQLSPVVYSWKLLFATKFHDDDVGRKLRGNFASESCQQPPSSRYPTDWDRYSRGGSDWKTEMSGTDTLKQRKGKKSGVPRSPIRSTTEPLLSTAGVTPPAGELKKVCNYIQTFMIIVEPTFS